MHRLYKRSICYSYNCTSLVRSSVSVSKAASGTKENRMKSRGFGSRGKELCPCVWNQGIQQNLSRGTVTRRVLLEEKKNAVRPLGKLSCNARALTKLVAALNSLCKLRGEKKKTQGAT